MYTVQSASDQNMYNERDIRADRYLYNELDDSDSMEKA